MNRTVKMSRKEIFKQIFLIFILANLSRCSENADGKFEVRLDPFVETVHITCTVQATNPLDLNKTLEEYQKTDISKMIVSGCNSTEEVLQVLSRFGLLEGIEDMIVFGNVTVLDLSLDKLPNLVNLELPGKNTAMYKAQFNPNLTYLDLSSNKIGHVPEDAFAKLKRLEFVVLATNSIGKLGGNVFSHNKAIYRISLENNPELELSNGIFANLPRLAIIDMYNCSLRSIPDDAFANSTSIGLLKLSDNLLETLPDLTMLTDLREIELTNNRFKQIPKFPDIPLSSLSMELNLIEEIPANIFDDLRGSIRSVYLAGNRIKRVDPDAFLLNDRLLRLDLSGNDYQPEMPLHYLFRTSKYALSELSLANNSIRSFANLHPDKLIGLEILYLHLNFIKTITFYDSFMFRRSPLLIHLGWNNITHIYFDPLEYTEQTPNEGTDIRFAVTVYVRDNPLRCDCHNYDFVTHLTSPLKHNELLHVDLENVYCDRLQPIAGTKQFLNCSLEELNGTCPQGCKCLWRPSTKSLYYDCAYGNLTEIPELPDQPIGDKFNQTEVLLQGNLLKEGPSNWSRGWSNVTKADLSYNKIETLTWVPPKIEVLNLTSNSMKSLQKDILDKLENVTKLNLEQNPWICGCAALDFVSFTRRHSMFIDFKETYCRMFTFNPKCHNYHLVTYFTAQHYEVFDANSELLRCEGMVDAKALLTCPVEDFGGTCPEGCKCLWKPYSKSLYYDCGYGNLTGIPELPVKQIGDKFNHTEVNLQGNWLQEGPRSEWDNVTKADLSRNRIEVFTWVPPNIVMLNLTSNFIKSLPKDVLEQLGKVKNLSLEKNPWNCNQIEETTQINLTRLTGLNLAENKIKHVPENSFTNLTRLEIIHLQCNLFRKLGRVFTRNKNIQSIYLNDNPHLEQLSNGIFSNLPRLKILDVSNCSLKSIPEDAFDNSRSIYHLSLQNNLLETLPDLSTLESLWELELYNNRFKKIPDFPDLRLVTLRLDQNLIEAIPADAFKNLSNIREIFLALNRINRIDSDAFLANDWLQTLDLTGNDYQPLVPLNHLFRSSVYSLVSLSLANNSIRSFDHLHPDKFIGLKHLDVNFNSIENVTFYDSLMFRMSPLVINLSWNNITHVYFNPLEYTDKNPDEGRSIRYNVTVYVNENPLRCDCHNYDLVTHFTTRLKHYELLDVNFERLRCEGMPMIEARDLLNCSVEDFGGTCPEGCRCFWKPYSKLLYYDCGYGNLSKIPELPVQLIGDIFNQTEVNLQGNWLREGPRNGWDNVTRADLSRNRIEIFTWVPPKIEMLDLTNNSIKSLPRDVLGNLGKVTKLSLESNPWNCDCAALDFVAFIRRHSMKNVTCGSSGKEVMYLTELDLCFQPFYLVLAAAVLLSITATFSALFYKYEEEILAWLWSNGVDFCCLQPEEELDKRKKFDAFISYAHQDSDFVLDTLLPVLESGPKPYKLCVHDRDWPAAGMIIEQIVKSVSSSRRTVVVLSTNFMKSVWGKMEFRAAHRQAMADRRNRVIIVVFGDFDLDSVDDEFKTYLRTNTYIKWKENDSWFWTKLKYSLPHPRRRRCCWAGYAASPADNDIALAQV